MTFSNDITPTAQKNSAPLSPCNEKEKNPSCCRQTKPFSMKNPSEEFDREAFEQMKKKLGEAMQDVLSNFYLDEEEEESCPCCTPYTAALRFASSTPTDNVFFLSPSAEIEALFEEMVSNLMLVHQNGITETTITLSNPHSLFFGGEIVIKEFSTAPKIFNVHLAASPEAIALYQLHAANLAARLEQKKLNFTINRIDTSFLNSSEKRRRVERKQPTAED